MKYCCNELKSYIENVYLVGQGNINFKDYIKWINYKFCPFCDKKHVDPKLQCPKCASEMKLYNPKYLTGYMYCPDCGFIK